MRATLSDAGIPQAAASYDAWGVPETPLIDSFGFTGELQQGRDVWLRARWYGAGRGSFGSRDPFEGMAQTPYSLQYYQYGYSNPVLSSDPSGQRVSPGDEGGSCGPGGKDASGHCWSMPPETSITQPLNAPSTVFEPATGITERLTPQKVPPPETIRGGPGLGVVCFLLLISVFLTGDTPQETNPLPDIPDNEAIQVIIYRGLDGDLSKDKTYFKKPVYSPSQFRLDDDGVSMFELHDLPGNKPYAAPFYVWIKKGYQSNDQGMITGSQTYNGNHCLAKFTPHLGDGKDHWSVNCFPRDQTPLALQSHVRHSARDIILNPAWIGPPIDRRLT